MSLCPQGISKIPSTEIVEERTDGWNMLNFNGVMQSENTCYSVSLFHKCLLTQHWFTQYNSSYVSSLFK